MTMPLILAIEADRRQSNLLATIGRQLGAELVIAATAEAGLAAIQGRVPDLILTSALLSPADETVLASRLRELDDRAAYVQTLTIPVLAKPSRRQPQAAVGLLGKLRGSTAHATAPSGCDPSLFATQVAEYLAHAADERRAAGAVEAVEAVDAGHEHQEIEAVAAGAQPDDLMEAVASLDLAFDVLDAEPPPAAASDPPAALPVARDDADEEEIELADALDDEGDADEEIVELSAASADLELEATLREFEAAIAETPTARRSIETVSAPMDVPEGIGDSCAIATHEAADEAWTSLAVFASWPRLENAVAAPSLEPPPIAALPAPPITAAAADQPPVAEPVAARAADPPPLAPPVAGPRRQEARPERKRLPRRSRPAPDEWGFFDPDQCGFAALLQKLDELSTSTDDVA